jgi:predicted permease
MGWRDLLLRLRALANRRRAESDLDEELSFHLEMEARKNQAADMRESETRRSASVRFGGVEQVREQCRDVRGLAFLESLVRDLRWGARILRKTPVFTAVAVASLAIGIGGNTAVFTLLDAVLLRSLPVRNPDQLVVVRWGARAPLNVSTTWATGGDDGHGGWTRNVLSWPIFTQMRAHSQTVHDVMGFSPLGPVNVAANGRALATGAMVASGNYFRALGVGAILGRTFTDDDESADGLPPAVASYRFWERAFGLDAAAIGKTVYVNGEPCMLIGVTPKEFFGVSAGGFQLTPEVDLTLPIRWRERLQGAGRQAINWFGDDLFWIQTMGRMPTPGAGATAASEWSTMIAANLNESLRRELGKDMPRVYFDPGNHGLGRLRATYQRPLLILMAVVGMTLLMACANLAGLLLARATARQREIMVRLAVGASRSRLVRQLLVEGLVLSAIGAAAGMAFAWWGVHALVGLVSTGMVPIPVTVSPDLRVLGFTIAVSLLTTFLFGLAPAMRATRVDVTAGLREEGGATQGIRRLGAGRVLLAMQVAIGLVLLAGATLFTRSLDNLRSLPLGFNPHHLLLFDLAPGKNGYDVERGNQLYAAVLERVKETPGVVGATLSMQRLIGGYMSSGSVLVKSAGQNLGVDSRFNFVGPDFFAVMQLPVVLGRGIEPRDMASGRRVAVINRKMAQRFEGSPLGKTFRWSSKAAWDVEVIGVVENAKYERLRSEVGETVYAPYTQAPWRWPQAMTFEVRTASESAAAVAGIRGAVAGVDRMLPLTEIKTQDAQIDDSLAEERIFASLVSLFSCIALALACVGLYGSVSYNATHRTRELGVRIALGARRASVMRMLLGQIAVTIVAGLSAGLPATWALTRVIESQLYGIRAHDPLSLLIASVVSPAWPLPRRFCPHTALCVSIRSVLCVTNKLRSAGESGYATPDATGSQGSLRETR